MSIIKSPSKSRPVGAKIVLIPALALGLIGGPVAAAGPATASTSERGCTVNPLRPTKHNDKVDFRIRVDCNGNKVVDIRQKRFEDDRRGRDDLLGKTRFWESFDRRDDSVTLHGYEWSKGLDEVYQLVSFRVRSGNSNNWSDWTSWEKSPVASFDH